MAKNKGWIKIHRDIMDNWIYEDAITFKVFLHLCMTVNIKEKKTMIDGNFATIRPGQRITSETKLASELGCAWRTLTKILNDLESDDMIKRQPIGRGFILTVTNYQKYQALTNVSDDVNLQVNFKVSDDVSAHVNQLKKSKDRLKTGKEKTVKNPPKRGGWLGKGDPPK